MVSETTIEMFGDYIRAVMSAQYGVCYPGKSNGVGGYDIEVANDPGRWWIRTWKNGIVAVDKAVPMGVPRDPQQRCLTRIINGERVIEMPDPTALRILYGNYANDAAVNNLPTPVQSGDKTILATVAPSISGGMNVCINAYPAAGLYQALDNVDLSGDVPGGTNEILWDVNYINPDGTVGWAQSAPRTLATATLLPPSDAREVVIPVGSYRTYAVSLSNGQTEISQSQFLNLQDDLAPSGVVAIDTSGASIGDVATWNGTDWVADPPSGGGGSGDYILIQDQKVQNTQGGTFTSGAWQTRDLTVLVANVGSHASLGSNQITLNDGVYQVNGSAPALGVSSHQTRLYNITDSVVEVIGTVDYQGSTLADNQGRSTLQGRFTVSGGPKVYEVQHQAAVTRAVNGFGVAANFTTEVYTTIELIRE